MSDGNWTGRTPRQSRTDYANCGWVYKQTATKRLRIAQAVGCILLFAFLGLMLGWRG